MPIRCACLIATFLVASFSAFGLSVSISGQFFSPCGQPRGELFASASGGALPYSYSWSNGATTSSISSLSAGSYTVTVTDNLGVQTTATQDVTLLAQYPTLNPVVSTTYCPSGVPYAFFPINDPTFLSPTEPTTFTGGGAVGQFVSDNGNLWIIELEDLGAGTYPITYSDALGCMGMFNFMVNGPLIPPGVNISGIGGSCSNGSTGAATVNVTQGNATLSLSILDAQDNVIFSTSCDEGSWTGGMISFTSLAPGDHWAVLDMDGYCLFDALPYFLEGCVQSAMFSIPDLGVDCGEVIGTLYVDADGDCQLDANENRVPNTVIAIAPGNSYTSTNDIGWFGTEALPGSTTFTEQHPILDQSCPGAINVIAGITQTLNIGLAPDAPLDAMVTMGSNMLRPGMSAFYSVQARNLTDAITGTVTLTMQLDPVLNYIGANPTPTSVAGNTLTWTDPDFTMGEVFEQDLFHVQVSLPPNPGLVGTVVSTTATLATQNVDADLGNNAVTVNTTVTASLDPNDKQARTSSQLNDDMYYLNADEWVDYTIRFQNTGTDTAFNVVVTDSLPPTLDPTTLLVGASSHAMNWSIGGPGILRFSFPNILLPDSTTNEPASHGLLTLPDPSVRPAARRRDHQ